MPPKKALRSRQSALNPRLLRLYASMVPLAPHPCVRLWNTGRDAAGSLPPLFYPAPGLVPLRSGTGPAQAGGFGTRPYETVPFYYTWVGGNKGHPYGRKRSHSLRGAAPLMPQPLTFPFRTLGVRARTVKPPTNRPPRRYEVSRGGKLFLLGQLWEGSKGGGPGPPPLVVERGGPGGERVETLSPWRFLGGAGGLFFAAQRIVPQLHPVKGEEKPPEEDPLPIDPASGRFLNYPYGCAVSY